MTAAETGTVQANGLRFHYLAMGHGPLALCLHGFPDSAWTWRLLLLELAAAGYRAAAPFLRGYAPTEVPADGCYQPGAVAAVAIALREALGGDADAVPARALSMGMGTILQARQIVLVATGAAKASAVRAMVEGPVTTSLPASFLQLHAAVSVVLDEAAAAALRPQRRQPVAR